MSRTRLFACLGLLVALCGCADGNGDAGTELAKLTVTGSSSALVPAFDSSTLHYALRCESAESLVFRTKARARNASIVVNGERLGRSAAEFRIENPDVDADIVIEVALGNGTSTYTIHCLADDFPEIEVLRSESTASADLLLVSPNFRIDGNRIAYLAVLDNNGVPRFRRRVDSGVLDFKRHANGLYTYASLLGRNEFDLRDSEIVVLDADFEAVDRLRTVGLTQTDNHDFLFTDEGSHIFISYHSTVRDLTAYGGAAEEVVGDSVIQEVAADGSVIFEWNSWDHMRLEDCQQTGYPRFPGDYAHLNSLDLTPDGDLIASFRGCAQILKIDRPTGEVIWQLGGTDSDFIIAGDPFNEFCGQHSAIEVAENRLLLFDNGNYCLGDREATFGTFSRVVEYGLDPAAGQAIYLRDYSLNGSYQEFTRSQGSVRELDNGNWLISWGNGPDVSISEVSPAGEPVYSARFGSGDSVAVTYRAYREPSLRDNQGTP